MLFKPLLGTDMSGKVGGIVASHNAGGAYFRAATIPTNPNTPQQNAVRAAVSQLSSLWQSALTPDQRTSWDVYASNVKLTNRIGEKFNANGINHYIRSNVARLQASLARIDDGPTTFNFAPYAIPSLGVVSEGTQLAGVIFQFGAADDPWANETGGFMFVYLSRPQNAGITFFRGPYRLAGVIVGDAVPPASPELVPVPFAVTEGQRLFMRVNITQGDGRIGSPTFQTALVEP